MPCISLHQRVVVDHRCAPSLIWLISYMQPWMMVLAFASVGTLQRVGWHSPQTNLNGIGTPLLRTFYLRTDLLSVDCAKQVGNSLRTKNKPITIKG